MRSFLPALAAALILTASQPAVSADSDCQPADNVNYVPGDGECMAIQTYLPDDLGAARTLVVVLHGDLSRGGGADYIFPIAEDAAEAGAIGVAMMRKGYSGGGRRSTGTASRDEKRPQMYTGDEMDAVAEATAALKAHYGVETVVMIGHSGGANTAGVILGRHPGLVQRALLMSCPCDVPRWRQMKGRNPWPAAESPDEYIGDIPPGALIRLVVGSRDTNTRASLSEDYAADAAARGLDAKAVVLDGASHNFNSSFRDHPDFRAALEEVLKGS